jgi:hypothetical protein
MKFQDLKPHDLLGRLSKNFRGKYIGLTFDDATGKYTVRTALEEHEKIPIFLGVHLWDGGNEAENIQNGKIDSFMALNGQQFNNVFTTPSKLIYVMHTLRRIFIKFEA